MGIDICFPADIDGDGDKDYSLKGETYQYIWNVDSGHSSDGNLSGYSCRS